MVRTFKEKQTGYSQPKMLHEVLELWAVRIMDMDVTLH